MSDQIAKQRFLALDVHEVSVVDTPANEAEFLVIKRKTQEQTMGEEAKTENAANVATVETQKAFESAMKSVTDMIKDIAKAANANTPAGQAEAVEAAADAVVEKAKAGFGAVRKQYRDTLKASGVTGEAYVTTLKSFDATLVPQSAETTKETTKAAEPKVEAVDALEQLSVGIQKAKIFTPARQEALMAAVATLKAVLDEMIQIPQASMPAVNTPKLVTSPDSTVAIAKSIGDLTELLKQSVTEQATIMADTQKRLENIEKARLPGNGLSADETDSKNTQVKKSGKLSWSNVL